MSNNLHNSQGFRASRDGNNGHLQPPSQPHNSYSAPSGYQPQGQQKSENSVPQQDQRPLPQNHGLPDASNYLGGSFTDNEVDDLLRQSIEAAPEEVFPEQDDENLAEWNRDEVPDLRIGVSVRISAPRNRSDKGAWSSTDEWIPSQAGSSTWGSKHNAWPPEYPNRPYSHQLENYPEEDPDNFEYDQMSDAVTYPVYPQEAQQEFDDDEALSYSQGVQPYSQGAFGQMTDNQGTYTQETYTQGLYNQGQRQFNPRRIHNSYSRQSSHSSENYAQRPYSYRLPSSATALPSHDARRAVTYNVTPTVFRVRAGNRNIVARGFPGGPATDRVVKNKTSSSSLTNRNASVSHISQYMGPNPMENRGMNDGYGRNVSATYHGWGPAGDMLTGEAALQNPGPPNRQEVPATSYPWSQATDYQNSGPSSFIGAPTSAGKPFERSKMKMESLGMTVTARNPGSKYLGDPSSKSFKMQQTNLADHLNCAVWIQNLHPDVKLAQFLDRVRVGALFGCHIYPPRDSNWTQAVKLMFKQPFMAAQFLSQVNTEPGIVYAGVRIRGSYNRDGYFAYNDSKSRVLHIRGDPENGMMNREFWDGPSGYFSYGVVYLLECSRDWYDAHNVKCLEFRFERIDGQAEAVYKNIRENVKLNNMVTVTYGADPCDPNSGYNAHPGTPGLPVGEHRY